MSGPVRRSAPGTTQLCPLTPAHLIGLGAFQAAAGLVWFDPGLAALPLALFVLLCLVAPFFPAWQLFGPVLTRGSRRRPVVALTFDDGPHPTTTPLLLDLLSRRGVPATFFVVGEQAAAAPTLIRRILAEGHTLGNHSGTHDPWLMLRRQDRLRREVAAGQAPLQEQGVRALAFRPPIGIVSPRLWRVLLEQGLYCVGFSRRAADFGNRRLRGLAHRLLRGVRGGDILLLHDGPVRAPATPADWLGQVELVLDGLAARGLTVVGLSELLARPVQESLATVAADREAVAEVGPPHAVATFYDGLAAGYDAEQAAPGFARLRQQEEQEVRGRTEWVGPGQRVLELGGGTGRCTLPLLERGAWVRVIELSPGMAAQLAAKVRAADRARLEVCVGDLRQVELGGPYDLILSCSTLEYVADLDRLWPRLHQALAPGGHLLLTTAARSPLRLFTQVGNALRQGIWLRARGGRSMVRSLRAAGFEASTWTTLGWRLPLVGGILLVVQARRPGMGA